MIQVSEELFLEMARIYKEQPQEHSKIKQWLEINDLERRAYRKLQHKRAKK